MLLPGMMFCSQFLKRNPDSAFLVINKASAGFHERAVIEWILQCPVFTFVNVETGKHTVKVKTYFCS